MNSWRKYARFARDVSRQQNVKWIRTMGNIQGSLQKEEIPIRQDNPYSAIQLLIGHSDIIRSLVVLDETRFDLSWMSNVDIIDSFQGQMMGGSLFGIQQMARNYLN
jgi:hypothetical protein